MGAKKIIDLTGKRFSRLVVLHMKEPHIINTRVQWVCKCDCGNIVIVDGNNLKQNVTHSCGCLQKESQRKTKNTKYNPYFMQDINTIIGTTFKNEQFLIDAEDYDKIKNYCWRIDPYGYVCALHKGHGTDIIKLHRIILNAQVGDIVDHINGNKLDNRKQNLRFVTKTQNNVNIKKRKDNTSGYTGVKRDTFNPDKWKAQISYNCKRIHLGTFDSFEDAVLARKQAEDLIHGEYSGEFNRQDFNKIINKEI